MRKETKPQEPQANPVKETQDVDATHGAELNITENSTVPGRSGEANGIRTTDADVTPRNLEADSDGA